MRRVLQPLRELAQKHQCVILLIRHLNKRGGGRSLYRGFGSIGIVGWCRSAWLVAAEPDDPSRRVLAQQKSNIGPPQPSLSYTIETSASGMPTVAWCGSSPRTACELLAPRRSEPRRPRPRDRAIAFLADFLKDGPRTTIDIWSACRKQGLNRRTVFRAKYELCIRCRAGVENEVRRFYWLLPGEELNLPHEAQTSEQAAAAAELRAYLQPLAEKYPSTPLDREDDPG